MLKTFQPNTQTLLAIVFAIGTITSFLIVVGMLVMAAWLLNLTMTVICEIAINMQHLYNRSDSLTQLLFIVIVGYVLFRLVRLVVRK